MKKVYSKPVIMFESFQLTASIAADCKYGETNVGGHEIYLDANSCDLLPGEGESIGEFESKFNICYHVPGDSVFNS